MTWEQVRVDAAWLVMSAGSLLAMLLWDAPLVQVVGTVVVLADLTRWVYWLVKLYERRPR